MGLDQYLKARKYIGGWEHSNEEEKAQFAAVMSAIGKSDFRAEGSPHLYVEVNVAYWRKANQIHSWFVTHAQDGVDDCRDYSVSAEDLQKLVGICKIILKSSKLVPGKIVNGQRSVAGGGWQDIIEDGLVMDNSAVAEELLPPGEGFFFGSTDFNEWYVQDLKRTIEQIETALKEFDGWDFQYSSSW